MTPPRLSSKAAALLQNLWGGAAAVYAHAQLRRDARRVCRRQHDRVRAEILVLREAVTIVAEHRRVCRAYYDTPHIDHPDHVRT